MGKVGKYCSVIRRILFLCVLPNFWNLPTFSANLKKLDMKLAIISTDDVATHNQWNAHLEEIDYKGRGNHKIEFPIINVRKQLYPKSI